MPRKLVVMGASLFAACFAAPAFAEGAAASVASAAVAPSAAPSEEPSPPPPSPPVDDADKGLWDAKPATRRSGFTASLMGGLSFGNVIGYPNDFSKWDVPAYRSATSGVGNAGVLYLGGALTDWFTFAIGFEGSTYGGSQNFSKEWAVLFHTEFFPLFSLGRGWRDVGSYLDFGTGQATIARRTDKAEFASSGSLSIGGIGAFWEPWRVAGHLAFGPYLAGTYEVSDSVTRVFGVAGFRAAFYGGP